MSEFPQERRAKMLDVLRATGTLRVNDLAQRLQVSVVTVRRDLTQLVDEGLVVRVHGGAMLAQAKRRPRTRKPGTSVIGLAVPSLDYYWPEISVGVRAQADELGLRVVMRNTDYSAKKLRAHVDMLVDSGAEGLLLAPNDGHEDSADLIDDLDQAGVPVVLVERERQLLGGRFVESVSTDHEGAAMQAISHLIGLGHTRIGLYTTVGRTHTDDIARGWRRQIVASGLAAGCPHWHLEERLLPGAAHVAASLRDDGVSAVLVHADREAIALVQQCEAIGLRVPNDVSVIAYDDEVAGLFSPALTALRPPRASLGEVAVSLLAQRLVDPGRPRNMVRMSASLVLRESTAPCASSDFVDPRFVH